MSNPFKDWTPQMVEDYNRRNKSEACKGMVLVPAPSVITRQFVPRPIDVLPGICQKKRPRKPLLNKTEARFLARLQLLNPGKSIGVQSITLKLAWDCRYTPDFWIHTAGEMRFYEVKGAFIREDGMVKLKAAAAVYPTFTFWLAQWKDDQWTIKPIPAQ